MTAIIFSYCIKCYHRLDIHKGITMKAAIVVAFILYDPDWTYIAPNP